ncbi:MAG: dTDP-glucose 4,6-dehydratase [Pseudomonadales bacterium]|nr:dTDP-glucose 4,6-dehydratase [Pseudomonadales bacterium]
MSKTLLVTGAAGFIGVNFCNYWLGRYATDRIIGFDILSYAGNRHSLEQAELNDRFEFVAGDILDQTLIETLLRDQKVDDIVHFAAESHVDRSITAPDLFLETNIMGTHSLLKAARQVWLTEQADGRHRFHHVSTDEVYGTLAPQDPAFCETTAYQPNSPYSASKAASDHMVRAYHHTYGLDVTTSNCSNNYGPFHFPEKLIPLCIINILNGKALPIYGDGQQIRDWLYVEDHCRGIDLVLTNGRAGETYNIGGNNEKANIDLVNVLCKLVDEKFNNNPELKQRFPDAPAANQKTSDSLITYVSDRPGHDRRYAVDVSKAHSELGYEPKETFEKGLSKTLNWYLDNENWWRTVLDGSYREWIDEQYGS